MNKPLRVLHRVIWPLAVGMGLAACLTKGQASPLQTQNQMPQQTQQAQASDPRNPVRLSVPFSVRLSVPFSVRQGKGFLALMRDPTGKLPASALRSAWPQLYLMTEQTPEANKPVKRILTLKDLQGEVSLRSCAEALSFVRLRTSPGVNSLLAESAYPTEVEIISSSDADTAFWFGIKEGGSPLPWSGFMGIVSPTDAIQLKLTPAACQGSQDRFVITRTMLIKEKPEKPDDEFLFPARYHADRIVEEVDKNGAYKVAKRTSITLPKFDDLTWSLPELGPMKTQPNSGISPTPKKTTTKKYRGKRSS